jgi:hypothetical protein
MNESPHSPIDAGVKPPESYREDEPIPRVQSEANVPTDTKDIEYAERYWNRLTEKDRKVRLSSFETTLESSDEAGILSQFVTIGKMTEEDREGLSARRQFYNNRGYWVGKYTYSADAGTVAAPLLNVNRLKGISEKCTATYEGQYSSPLFGVTVAIDAAEIQEVERLLIQVRHRLVELVAQGAETGSLQPWESLFNSIDQDLQRYTSGIGKGTSATAFGNNIKDAYRFLKETGS